MHPVTLFLNPATFTFFSSSTCKVVGIGTLTALTTIISFDYFIGQAAIESLLLNIETFLNEMTIKPFIEKKTTLEQTVTQVISNTQINQALIKASVEKIVDLFNIYHQNTHTLAQKIAERKELEEKTNRLLALFGQEESQLFQALTLLDTLQQTHQKEIHELHQKIAQLIKLNDEKEMIIHHLSHNQEKINYPTYTKI
jgi:hypothetical protein